MFYAVINSTFEAYIMGDVFEENRQNGMDPSCKRIIYGFFFRVGAHTFLDSSETV